MSLEQLPRDVQLSVIRKFDMETRIKTKIIGKLVVPDALTMALTTQLSKLISNRKRWLEGDSSFYIATLHLTQHKCYECYFDKHDELVYWYLVNTENVGINRTLPMLHALFPRNTLLTQ